jgi:hypothetical protein
LRQNSSNARSKTSPVSKPAGAALPGGGGCGAHGATIVSEVADQRYVGTAMTLQLAFGYILTVVTIWVIPVWWRSWSGGGRSWCS